MKLFARNLTSLLPTGITLPPELIETFDWMEDQGWHHVREGGAPEDHWLSFYPTQLLEAPMASHIAFGGTALPFSDHWSTPDPSVDARIAEIGVTSGDGARVAIWLDDAGKQQFVHIGHDTLGLITDDPLTLLQFLAMGYPEPGALEDTTLPPLQATLEFHGASSIAELDGDEQPVAPTALQAFLKTRFGIDMPTTAHDLGIMPFPEYHDTDTTDPFARWIAATTPEPTEAELAYELELMRAVESLNLDDTDTSDTIMQKIGSLFTSKGTDP